MALTNRCFDLACTSAIGNLQEGQYGQKRGKPQSLLSRFLNRRKQAVPSVLFIRGEMNALGGIF
jgi:hypothetical protein